MGYVIDSIERAPKRWWSEQSGDMVSRWATIHDTSGNVYMNVELPQPATAPAPRVGQTLDGNLERGRFGLVLRYAHNPNQLEDAA